MRIKTAEALPQKPEAGIVYVIEPNFDERFYEERTDRNIGWISREEQSNLRKMTIGIAGCGGMGGLLGQIFARLGVGEIRIADSETFDISNINRQFGAIKSNIGLSKALTTARMVHETVDDVRLVVYPQGICEEVVEHFVAGCDVICDEIEFWAVASRILLHQYSRRQFVSVFNCNTVGFSTNLMLFRPRSRPVEDLLGFSYEEAKIIQEKLQVKDVALSDRVRVMNSMLDKLVPVLPEYCGENLGWSNEELVKERLMQEGKASIITPNPFMASGFLADRVLLFLLERMGQKREVVNIPEPPHYLHFDAGKMIARVVTERRGI